MNGNAKISAIWARVQLRGRALVWLHEALNSTPKHIIKKAFRPLTSGPRR